jgi:hypothetical protein
VEKVIVHIAGKIKGADEKTGTAAKVSSKGQPAGVK